MAKISIDCGRKHRCPGGRLSELPAVSYSKKLRDSLCSGACLAIEELREHVDLLELVRLSHNLYTEGFRTEITVITLDPLLNNEEPHHKKATSELTCRIKETDDRAICKQIVTQFWENIRSRQAELELLCKAFPTRKEKN